MENIKTVKDLVSLWPNRQAFAEAISLTGEVVPVTRVHRWVALNSINAKYFYTILVECEKAGLEVTAETLVSIHHQPKKEKPND